ncbi:hypothetical protein XA68_11771 [Ophiocordyceps unilateralis]|uniref:Trichothecene 3-O-acetyltransferase n=1 Tax=Ophiocordyceps unilateralis TaxID=268505 RepID=A0A2A9PFQ8_OPHUN|nr:hypothetical protein XA68_11771 [Ophiocordyceps unilateralis]
MKPTLVKLDVPCGEEVIRLSTLDQQAQRNYLKFLLCFELEKTAKVERAIQHVKQGLAVALSEIPDFGSTVVPVPGSKRKELQLQLDPDSGVPLRVVHHAAANGTFEGQQSPLAGCHYSDLAKDNFPLATIPSEFLFVPHPSCEDECPDGLAALLVQLNVINGGLILAICWHHSVADAQGMATFLRSWSGHTKTAAAQGFADSPVVSAERDDERWRLSYGTRHATLTPLSDYSIDATMRAPLNPASPHLLDRLDPRAETATMSTWHFSKESLQSLRSKISEADVDEQFTNSEAVSALVWKHLSQARQLQDSNPNGTSLFSTRMNYRGRVKQPFHDGFLGNINEPNARTRQNLEDVCAPSTSHSLARLAKLVRDAVVSLDEKSIKDFIGLVDKLPAVTDLTWSYDTFPGPDLAVTDTSGMDMRQQDWGRHIGYPTSVRLGSREKGVAYILPQDRDGGFEVQLQCESEAVERLKTDDVFNTYARFLC